MTIIPQIQGFLQVGLSNSAEQFSRLMPACLNAATAGLTFVQRQALFLYEAGLNVFPQPLSHKMGYPWKRLQYTRLYEGDHFLEVRRLFDGSCNLALMCGHTSGNLFVIDCESLESFQHHLNQLHRRRIPIWAVTTGRGGHIYLRAREGEVDNIAHGVLVDAEIRGRNAYVLGVGSLHPSGTVYRWLMREGDSVPEVSLEQINWLRDQRGYPVRLKARNHKLSAEGRGLRYVSPYSQLSQATRLYILEGHLVQAGERNARLFAAACDLAGNDYAEDEARNLLAPPARLSGLPALEIDSTIRSAYSRPRVPARSRQAPTPALDTERPQRSRHWHYALLYTAHLRYEGRTANNQRALLLAFIERSRVSTNEHGVFRASIRELAQLARMGTATVQRLLLDFARQKRPLLFKVGLDEMSGATLWRWSRVVLDRGKHLETKTRTRQDALPRHWLLFAQALFSLDATESGGLGKGASYLFQVMRHDKQARMPSEWVQVAGMSLSQVNYALSKLREFGLIERLKHGWRAVFITNQALEARVVAACPAVRHRRQRREARFYRERQLFVSRILHRARIKREGATYYDLMAHPPPIYDWEAYQSELLDNLLCREKLHQGMQISTPDGCFARWIPLERLEFSLVL